MKRLFLSMLVVAAVGCAGEGDFVVDTAGADVGTGGGADAGATPDLGGFADTEGRGDGGDVSFPEPCDVVAQDCPMRDGRETACVPSLVDGVPRCIVLAESREEGAPCAGNHQCQAGTACVLHPQEEAPRCSRLCERAQPEQGCGADGLCTGTFSTSEEVGFCRAAPVVCDIYAQDCADEFACVLGRHPLTGERGTFCGLGGSSPEGGICGEAGQSCQAGHICLGGADDGQRCHRVCRGDSDCTAPSTCTGRTAELGIDYCR